MKRYRNLICFLPWLHLHKMHLERDGVVKTSFVIQRQVFNIHPLKTVQDCMNSIHLYISRKWVKNNFCANKLPFILYLVSIIEDIFADEICKYNWIIMFSVIAEMHQMKLFRNNFLKNNLNKLCKIFINIQNWHLKDAKIENVFTNVYFN